MLYEKEPRENKGKMFVPPPPPKLTFSVDFILGRKVSFKYKKKNDALSAWSSYTYTILEISEPYGRGWAGKFCIFLQSTAWNKCPHPPQSGSDKIPPTYILYLIFNTHTNNNNNNNPL